MADGVPWLVVGYVAPSLAAGVLLRSAWRNRDQPGGTCWVLLLGTVAFWSLLYGVSLLVADPAARLLAELVLWLPRTWVGVVFLAFALAYTGRAHLFRSPWFVAVVALEAAATLLTLTNPVHGLVWDGFSVASFAGVTTVTYSPQPLFYAVVALTYLSTGVGLVLLAETVASYGARYRRHALVIITAVLLPGAASLLWVLRVGVFARIDLTTVVFLVSLVLVASALFDRGLFELTPATRRAGERAAIDDLGSAVAIVDAAGRVIDLNAEAERLLEVDTDAALGEQLSDLLSADLDLRREEQSVTPVVDGERRRFKLVASRFETAAGTHGGYTVVLQDVTAERQRKQRLEVLNRILRHNLRNDLNVVRLRAERLGATLSDADQRDHVDAIQSMSADLVDLGEKARWATRALEDVSFRTVPLQQLLEEAVVGVVETDDVTVTLDVPPDLTLYSDPELLSLVFTSVVENAIEHNDGDPTVDISVSESDSWVRVDVTDDGPGIPDHERAVIEGGGESALEHTSGIGLWLIHWGVTVLGGEVGFEVDDHGTTVSVRLPTVATPPEGPTPVADADRD